VLTRAAPVPLTVSVVIPTTGREVLAESVGRVLEQDPLEVVVVADRQRERVCEILTTNRLDGDPRLRVVAGPERGAAPARQAGSDQATGDIILFLDDDVVPDPGLVAGHRDAHAAAPDRVVVGYMPVAPELVEKSVTAAIYSDDYEAECAELDAQPELVLLALWGGSVSMRRSDCLRVPQAVATFDGRLLEDTELGLRCAQEGLAGVFDRRLTAVHHHDQSVETMLRNAARQMEGAEVLESQYPGLFKAPDQVAALPVIARAVVAASRVPIVGRPLRAAIVGIAARLGRGRVTGLRKKVVALARVVVQQKVIDDRAA
jgi:GT2 family glycosyltransferase